MKRTGKDGRSRYTAIYIDADGNRRSAGTFSTKKLANDTWRDREAQVAMGRGSHLQRGKKLFRAYVEEDWLPGVVYEASTLDGYLSLLRANILDHFGDSRMMDIQASHIRRWISDLRQRGLAPATLAGYKRILSAILSTAVDDDVIVYNPCHRVKTPPIPDKPRRIVTAAEFEQFREQIPHPMYQLLVTVAIETGMRWGELAELRVHDIDTVTRTLTVCRAVNEVNPKLREDGAAFVLKQYPKNKRYRQLRINRELCEALEKHIADRGLLTDDLLFTYEPERQSRREASVGTALGWTEPNEKNRTYRHGTASGYGAGRCRCEHCRAAVAAYRASRRAAGKDNPRKGRRWKTDGYIPRNWFRNQVIKPALKAANLTIDIRMHDLRHAHASWLLAGGASLQVVKDRLGHSSITTTERYLHAVTQQDETALEALDTFLKRATQRGNTPPPSPDSPNRSTYAAQTPEQILQQLNRHQEAMSQLQTALTALLSPPSKMVTI